MSEDDRKFPQVEATSTEDLKSIPKHLQEVETTIAGHLDNLKRTRSERRRLVERQNREARCKTREAVEDYVKSLPPDSRFTVPVLLALGVKAEASGKSVASVFDWLDGKHAPATTSERLEETGKPADTSISSSAIGSTGETRST